MAKYKIEFRSTTERELNLIPKKDQIRIIRKIASLGEDPRPVSCKKLSGQERYRIRQGDYRILYEIFDELLVVAIVKAGHRRDSYE